MGDNNLNGLPKLPNNWKWECLDSLSERVSVGHVGETSSVFTECDDGVTFLRSQNVRPGKVELGDVKLVKPEFHVKSKKSQLKAGDILVVRVGQNRGDCAVLPNDMGEVNCANIVFARLKNTKLAHFIGYFLNSKLGRSLLLAVSTGSAQGVLNTKSVAKVLVPVPPECDALDISDSLRVLDDKIELNCQTNQTLEKMAQVLFKSWFVDFDPIFDNAIASGMAVNDFPKALQKKAEQRQQIQQQIANGELEAKPLPEDIRQLFPSEFEQIDEPSIGINGWIPKGWEKSNLKSFGKVVTGKTPPKKIENAFADKGLPFITPSDVDSDVFTLTIARHLSSQGVTSVKNNVIEQGSVCVTCIGSQMGKTVIAPYKSVTNQQLNSIVLAKQSYRNYVFMNLRLRREELFNLGSSGSTMPILNKSSFEGLNTLKPTELVLNEFSKVTEKLIDKILLGSHQNEELSKVRDTLLPKLISGEFQLPAESINAEVPA